MSVYQPAKSDAAMIAALRQYETDHGLIIRAKHSQRCQRHEMLTDREAAAVYTCWGCFEELAAYQLSLGHETRAFHHTDRNGLKGYTDPRGRNAGNRRQR